MSWLENFNRRELRRREKEERKLSFNQGARILDPRHPVLTEVSPDDESLSDCNFVEQGASVEPLMFSDEPDPDLEDNLGDEHDYGHITDDDREEPADRYSEMAKKFDVPEIIRGDDDTFDQVMCGMVMTDEPATKRADVIIDVIYRAKESARRMQIASVKRTIAATKNVLKHLLDVLEVNRQRLNEPCKVDKDLYERTIHYLTADRQEILGVIGDTRQQLTDARRELKRLKGKPNRNRPTEHGIKPQQVEPMNLNPKLLGEVADETSFINTVNELLLRRMRIGDSRENKGWRHCRSWKHNTLQTAQFLRHTWRGVRQVRTIRRDLEPDTGTDSPAFC